MAYILGVAFSPSGRAILCQKMGQITLTRSGNSVLRTVYDLNEDPIIDIILNLANNVSTTIGDGVKTFIFFLASFLRQSHLSRSSLILQLKSFKSSLDVVSELFIGDNINFKLIIEGFFRTRFTCAVYEMISPLIWEWVSMNSKEGVFRYLLDNFDILCTRAEGTRPLHESRVVQGIQFEADVLRQVDGEVSGVLKVLYYSDEADCTNDIVKLLNAKKEGTLLVTNIHLSAKARFFLVKNQIHTAHCVSSPVTKFLFDYSLQNLSPVIFSVTPITQRTSVVSLKLDSFQLRLCSPTQGLSTLYLESIQDCLRLCDFAESTRSHLVPCGKFEKLFSLYLSSAFDIEAPVVGREELLFWHEVKDQIADRLNQPPKIPFEDLDSMIVHIVREMKEIKLREECVRFLCESLMAVARKLPMGILFEGFEPIQLKLAILQKALSGYFVLCDGNVIPVKKKA